MKIEMNVHESKMIEWARKHPEALVLSADLGGSCEIKKFSETFPERYFNFGLAEQNMVGWAAGLAREGFRPYIHTFGVFVYRRTVDQIEMSVAYPNLPVTFLTFCPGLTTPGGVTHQATNDVAVIRNIPNMTILDIGDATDAESALDVADAAGGPVYIRMLRKDVPRLFPAGEPMRLNRGRVLSEGADVAVFSSSICTEEAMYAAEALRSAGLSVQHMHISTLKPFTDPAVLESLKKVRYGAVTLENHTVIGGLGSAVAEVIAEHGLGVRLVRLGLQDIYAHGASKKYLLRKYGMDAAALVAAVEKLVGRPLGIDDAALDAARSRF